MPSGSLSRRRFDARGLQKGELKRYGVIWSFVDSDSSVDRFSHSFCVSCHADLQSVKPAWMQGAIGQMLGLMIVTWEVSGGLLKLAGSCVQAEQFDVFHRDRN